MWIAFPQIFCATLIVPVVSWNLSYFAAPHASIGQVAVWRNRAFICLPRYDLGTIRATLLEAPWPESMHLTRQLTQQVKPVLTSSKQGLIRVNYRGTYNTRLLHISNELLSSYLGYSESKYRLRTSLAHLRDCHFAHVQ